MASSSNTSVLGSPGKSGGGGRTAAAPKNGSLTPGTEISAGAGGAEVAVEKVSDAVGGLADKAAIKSDEAAAEGSPSGDDVNGASKKAVWNKATNGAGEAVMGGVSWPALSDKGKGPLKSSVESSKSFPEAGVPSLQGTTPAPSARKQLTINPHPNSIQSNTHPARQKSFKRHGGSTPGNNGSPTQPLPPPPPFGQSQLASVPSNQNTSSTHKNLNLESGQKVVSEPQSHGTNDRPQHNNPQRKGNTPHQHGDASYNHRYGARKDQDRPNRNWNTQGSFNGRDIHPQPTGGLPRGIVRHIPSPHSSAMYVAPPLSPTMRPFGPPVSYPEFPFYYVPVQPESVRGMSIPYPGPAPHLMFMQYIDPELFPKVISQIDYYFSNENLVKDTYLRNNMDEEGWVPIELIASFKQVKKLTDNVAYITEAIQTSTVVEVKDDKVRRRNDWMKWLMPGSLKVSSPSAYEDSGSSSSFVSRIQKLNVGKENSDIPSTASPSGDPSSQHQDR